MRHVLTAAAAIAVCGLFALTPARAEPSHDLGGPIQNGKLCWASSSAYDSGYWKACPKPVKVAKKSKKMKS